MRDCKFAPVNFALQSPFVSSSRQGADAWRNGCCLPAGYRARECYKLTHLHYLNGPT
jgi:hypothetical protein